MTPNNDDTATGATLFAGFIDIHIHGAVGVDTMEADADLLHALCAELRD